MEKAVLYGNGVNRIDQEHNESKSWITLLKEIAGKAEVDCDELINEGKYTMAYEKMAVHCDFDENFIKELLIAELSKTSASNAYNKLMNINASHFLTTNYEHHLIKKFEKKEKKSLEQEESEDIYSMRRYHTLTVNDKMNLKFWNIHGSIAKTKSIMLGYDHYCGYIGKIDGFIKGTYKYGNDRSIGVEPLDKKLDPKSGIGFDGNFWVELFFNTNLHITGLGMSYDEYDLWWILNKRARMIKDPEKGKNINNNITYYCAGIEGHKRMLLEAFGVTVVNYGLKNHKKALYQSFDDINADKYTLRK